MVLSISIQHFFTHYITPKYLYSFALFFAVVTLALVMMIYVYLYIKKKRFITREKISGLLEEWISEALTEPVLPETEISSVLSRYLQKKPNRQFVVASLIGIKKNVTGSAAENITKLYEKLGLEKDSLQKMRSMVWHEKAKGIYELYMMNQRDQLPEIFKYTNSDNEYVRMEAQIAITGFSGFDGLVFLDSLSYSLNEWQQLKLLEQLDKLDVVTIVHLPLWLKSGNDYVVHFALKLADIYQQLQVHDDVVACLGSKEEKIRRQAIKTLGRVANDETSRILKNSYSDQVVANKREILKQLYIIGTNDDVPFLLEQLNEEDDILKIEAARAMARISEGGVAVLEERTADSLFPLSITQQIKYEMAR